MNQACFVEETKAVQELLSEDSHQSGAQSTKLILLDQLVEIDTEQLENKTEMLSMDECVFEP